MADSVHVHSERRAIAKNVNDIRVEEYRTLRVELDDTVKALRQVELYTIGSVAAVYAWLATHVDVLAPGTLPWWIPLGIAGFGLFKNRALISQLRSITEYIQNNLEPSIVVEGVHPLKWYEYLRDHYPKILSSRSPAAALPPPTNSMVRREARAASARVFRRWPKNTAVSLVRRMGWTIRACQPYRML
jgi:hypothetical protein